MRSNRAELAPLRGKRSQEAVELWVQAFGKGNRRRAERYALAVATLLGGSSGADHFGHLSPNTRKAYIHAMTEFFEWVASKHGHVVAPEDVTRKDAEDYVNWLANKSYSLTAEKLRDGDRPLELEVYEIVKELGSAKLKDIEAKASSRLKREFRLGDKEQMRTAFSKLVRSLVTVDVLDARPTLCTLRETYPQAGITRWTIPAGKNGKSVRLEDVFTYTVMPAEPVSRTTIAQRVSALSSLWESFMEGDNREEPLLKYNVWNTVKKRVNRGIESHKKIASREQKVPDDEIIHVLKNLPNRTLVDLRNKAIYYLMVFAGLRVTELLQLRRARPDTNRWPAWFDGSEPPALQLMRKGGKVMRLPYPPAALRALIEFQSRLDQLAAPPYAQSNDPEADHFYPPHSRAWHYQKLQLPDAPLFPPLVFWGKNLEVDYRKSMTRQALDHVLSSLAKEAGLSEEACRRIHPHAIRHFSANAMVDGGKKLREVQAILGHSSITTTESYLRDIEEDVRLSGQDAILSFLEKQGAFEGEAVTPPSPRRADSIEVETTAIEVEEPPEEQGVSDEEVTVIQQLKESVPEHNLPVSPPDFDPPATAMATDNEVVVETEGEIIGLDDDPSKESGLEDLQSTVRQGRSPGSPDWVYEAMADPKARHETAIFNRGGERDLDWLKENYPKLPVNFGVGHESFLPWYVKARGNITRGGYYRGIPPFPVWSPDQVNPETSTGKKFLENIEKQYSRFVHGDPERGELPSPMRSVGIVRWYGFFAYQTAKLQEHFAGNIQESIPHWEPYNTVVKIGDFRSHNDEWLQQWLVDNAHTFRASIDAMKRGVKRGERDVTDSFLKSSFEGIELVSKMPDWMIEDDPVRALYEQDPDEWRQMIKWLKNVTGQVLDPSREVDRSDQLDFADEEMKMRARNVRDLLMDLSKAVDKLTRAKVIKDRDEIREQRRIVRAQLMAYALTASGTKRLAYTDESLYAMSTRDFNRVMEEEYERLGVPNPNKKKYRGKKKISRIVTELFPNLPVLDEENIFAGSTLFNPRWFRIDELNKTIQIEEDERIKMVKQFGQDPELLVRRATRAMWESKNKDYEALWGVMMSYFSWIMPTGKEMESMVLGIPVTDLGDEELNVEARNNWLKTFLRRVQGLATGRKVKEEPWEIALREMEEEEGKEDAMDHLVTSAYDFMASSSISEYEDEPSFDPWTQLEDESFVPNIVRRLMPNKRGTYLMLEGEKPQGWYKVDIFGRTADGFRPNAPPKLMSPGAVYLSQKETFAARQLLPSPFRMVSAMEYL